jgi:hypothetical protein
MTAIPFGGGATSLAPAPAASAAPDEALHGRLCRFCLARVAVRVLVVLVLRTSACPALSLSLSTAYNLLRVLALQW